MKKVGSILIQSLWAALLTFPSIKIASASYEPTGHEDKRLRLCELVLPQSVVWCCTKESSTAVDVMSTGPV